MKKSKTILLVLILSLVACTVEKNKSELADKSKLKQSIELLSCMNEAEALLKLNNAYATDVSSFYKLIRDAKYYASISNKVSDSTRVTITPFFEYRVYEFCNKISQLLMVELKKNSPSNKN